MGVVNLFCAPASKPRGVAEDVAASVSLSFIHPLMTSAEDSQRGAVTKPHTYIGSNGSGKHLCIKNK